MLYQILIVSNNTQELTSIREVLLRDNALWITLASSGNEATKFIRDTPPDLLVGCHPIDDTGAEHFCQQIRVLSDCPLLLLCPEDMMNQRLRALRAGADVCLVKPFDEEELSAYAHALIRRHQRQTSRYHFGMTDVNLKTGSLWRNGELISVSWREFDLLRFFILHADEVVSRERILEEVWQKPMNGPTRTVDQYVMRLRKLIEPSQNEHRYIRTVHGYGYKFTPDSKSRPADLQSKGL